MSAPPAGPLQRELDRVWQPASSQYTELGPPELLPRHGRYALRSAVFPSGGTERSEHLSCRGNKGRDQGCRGAPPETACGPDQNEQPLGPLALLFRSAIPQGVTRQGDGEGRRG